MEQNNHTLPIRLSAFVYSTAGATTIHINSLAELNSLLSDETKNVWINIPYDQTDTVAHVAKLLKLPSQIQQSIGNHKTQVKTQWFQSFLACHYKIRQKSSKSDKVFLPISFVMTKHVLFSFSPPGKDIFDTIRKRLLSPQSRLSQNGVDYLLYDLIDAIVDDFQSIIDRKTDELIKLEDTLINHPLELDNTKLFKIKRDVLKLKKLTQPIRESVTQLLKQDTLLIQNSTLLYLRDLQNNCMHLSESIADLRDTMANITNIYLSWVNTRMNDTMRVLTIFATIFIPLTFIAGVYGMNFRFMPELNWHYGYFVTVGIMVTIAIGLLGYFKRKRWF